MAQPKCVKCGETMYFQVSKFDRPEGKFILLYCDKCGAIQGIARG